MQLVVEESNPGHDCGCRRRFWRFLGFPSVPPSVRTRHVSYYTADVSLVVAVAVDGGVVSDDVVFVVVDMSLTTQRLRVLPLLLLLLMMMLYCNVVDVIFDGAVVVGDLLLHSGCEFQLLLMTSWSCCCRCCCVAGYLSVTAVMSVFDVSFVLFLMLVGNICVRRQRT